MWGNRSRERWNEKKEPDRGKGNVKGIRKENVKRRPVKERKKRTKISREEKKFVESERTRVERRWTMELVTHVDQQRLSSSFDLWYRAFEIESFGEDDLWLNRRKSKGERVWFRGLKGFCSKKETEEESLAINVSPWKSSGHWLNATSNKRSKEPS